METRTLPKEQIDTETVKIALTGILESCLFIEGILQESTGLVSRAIVRAHNDHQAELAIKALRSMGMGWYLDER